jgi:SAM-dependent methyltransferase
MQISPSDASAYNLSEHQCSFFNAFLGLYDIQDKDILEVGGAMPSTLVLDQLGAKSWTCIQSSEYAQHRSDNQEPSSNKDGYTSIFANIEDLSESAQIGNKYDAVFSIACFEHIHKFPQALHVMHKALKPEGVLFSLFAPIWSGPWGQHYTDSVPDRFESIKPPGGWTTNAIFGPWDHLLMSRYQFFEHYRHKFDKKFAEELTYLTYNSPQINRYFFEDYVEFIKQEKFNIKILKGMFEFPNNTEIERSLEELARKYAVSGYQNFSDAGIVAFLEKQ